MGIFCGLYHAGTLSAHFTTQVVACFHGVIVLATCDDFCVGRLSIEISWKAVPDVLIQSRVAKRSLPLGQLCQLACAVCCAWLHYVQYICLFSTVC